MDVFCFDFDGVICDSAPETALSAWNASRAFWPGSEGELPPQVQERFCRLRPVMHTGFEAVPLMRMIVEGAVSDAELFAEFDALRDRFIARHELNIEDLQRVFGQARDRLIEADAAAWLRRNAFYDGMRDLLAEAIARHPVFVITTKQERFVVRLLAHHGLELPAERLHGLERKRAKPDVLSDLLADPAWQGATFHFIEDRLETLQDVIARPRLAAVRLYLADWGYSTPAQREFAATLPRVRVVSRSAFARVVSP